MKRILREAQGTTALAILTTAFSFAITACNSQDQGTAQTNTATVVGDASDTPATTPTITPSGNVDPGTPTPPTPNPTPTAIPTKPPVPTPTTTPPPVTTSATCVSTDSNHICLGLKLVAYRDSAGRASVTAAGAETLMAGINRVWSACNIAFQLEEYAPVDPTQYGLSYGTNSENQLNSIRDTFGNDTTMLVAATGPWNGVTIAWTSMPGAGPFGTIVGLAYANNPLTVGHELGHYMGLYHISDSSNLMNPYIGSNTSGLTSSQCTTARNMDYSNWSHMLRN